MERENLTALSELLAHAEFEVRQTCNKNISSYKIADQIGGKAPAALSELLADAEVEVHWRQIIHNAVFFSQCCWSCMMASGCRATSLPLMALLQRWDMLDDLNQPTQPGASGFTLCFSRSIPPLQESNLKHSINGFMYCNMPGLEARLGQRVRFYVMSLGSEVRIPTTNVETVLLSMAAAIAVQQLAHGMALSAADTPAEPSYEQVCFWTAQVDLHTSNPVSTVPIQGSFPLCVPVQVPYSLWRQVDLHTPNLESATLDWQGQGESSLFFLPGNMETADTQLTAEGRWLFRCRVADHVGAGMEVLFCFCIGFVFCAVGLCLYCIRI